MQMWAYQNVTALFLLRLFCRQCFDRETFLWFALFSSVPSFCFAQRANFVRVFDRLTQPDESSGIEDGSVVSFYFCKTLEKNSTLLSLNLLRERTTGFAAWCLFLQYFHRGLLWFALFLKWLLLVLCVSSLKYVHAFCCSRVYCSFIIIRLLRKKRDESCSLCRSFGEEHDAAVAQILWVFSFSGCLQFYYFEQRLLWFILFSSVFKSHEPSGSYRKEEAPILQKIESLLTRNCQVACPSVFHFCECHFPSVRFCSWRFSDRWSQGCR